MDCPKCGAPAYAGEARCQICGASFDAPTTTQVSSPRPNAPTPPPSRLPIHAPAPRTSGIAITALVLGVLAILSCGLTALPGVIFGIIGIVQTGKSQGRLTGNGMAIAGLATSTVVLVALPIIAAIIFPVFSKARDKAQMSQCMNNQKQIALAASMYASENNEVLPSQWADMKLAMKVTHCTASSNADLSSNSYGYNRVLVKRSLRFVAGPEGTLLTADGGDSNNYLNSEADIVKRHNHKEGFIASYADGHIEYIKAGTPVSLSL